MPICKRNRKKSWLKIVLQSFSQRMIINDPISSSCRSRSFRMVSIRCKMMMREKARHEHSSSTSLLVTTFGINYEETNEQQSRSLHFYPPCVTLQSILTTARVKGSFLRSLLRFLRSMMQEEEGHDQHITNQVYTTGKISTTTTNHLLLLLLLGEKSGPLGPAGIPTQAQDRLLDYRKKKRKSKKKWPRTSHCWPLVRHCPTRDNKKKTPGYFGRDDANKEHDDDDDDDVGMFIDVRSGVYCCHYTFNYFQVVHQKEKGRKEKERKCSVTAGVNKRRLSSSPERFKNFTAAAAGLC